MKFTKDHEWVKIEGDIATIGITKFAADALGELVYVELPKVGNTSNFPAVVSVLLKIIEAPLSKVRLLDAINVSDKFKVPLTVIAPPRVTWLLPVDTIVSVPLTVVGE